jgi:NDP-sugar pyrophosphorylase family protein
MASLTDLNLVLLAAGKARRYKGIKPLAPIGPNGEAVIDLSVSDAIDAGFSHITIVINPKSGPLIQEHIRSNWPESISVSYAHQEIPLGTVDAVRQAQEALDPSLPFGVLNGDDLYGADALRRLAETLNTTSSTALIGFHLDRALVEGDPVTRGVCTIKNDRLLTIAERRNVVQRDGRFEANDEREPQVLPPGTIVSMNLWGFRPYMWELFTQAMEVATDASEDNEVLLPELVADMVAGKYEAAFPGTRDVLVSVTESPCVGVTHPDDLVLVQKKIREQIADGHRQEAIFQTHRH